MRKFDVRKHGMRVLVWAAEATNYLLRLMRYQQGGEAEGRVQGGGARREGAGATGKVSPFDDKEYDLVRHGVQDSYITLTGCEKELADFAVIKNLTTLFERPHAVSSLHIACATDLINRVLDLKQCNIAIFFNLHWFGRMHKLLYKNEYVKVHWKDFDVMHALFQRIVPSSRWRPRMGTSLGTVNERGREPRRGGDAEGPAQRVGRDV